MEFEFIRYEKRDRIAYVTINRPEVMDALHPPAQEELARVWADGGTDPERRVGVVDRLPRHVPLKVAMGMILTGRPVSAAEAARIGLVNEVVPAGDLLAAAERWAREMSECSPLAVQASKQAALQGLGRPVAEAMVAHYPLVQKLFTSEDVVEGPRAFAEKRKPVWRGRRAAGPLPRPDA